MKMTLICLFVIALIGVIHKLTNRKKPKKSYDMETPEGRKDYYNDLPEIRSRKIFKILYIVISIPVLIVALTADMFITDYWLIFTGKRTKFIEQRYSITVDSHVDLKKYKKTFAGQSGRGGTVEFVTDLEPAEFIEKNCRGMLIKYAKDDKLYFTEEYLAEHPQKDYDDEPATPDTAFDYYTENDTEIYWYDGSGKRCCATFTEWDGKYKAKIEWLR